VINRNFVIGLFIHLEIFKVTIGYSACFQTRTCQKLGQLACHVSPAAFIQDSRVFWRKNRLLLCFYGFLHENAGFSRTVGSDFVCDGNFLG